MERLHAEFKQEFTDLVNKFNAQDASFKTDYERHEAYDRLNVEMILAEHKFAFEALKKMESIIGKLFAKVQELKK